MRRRYVTRNNVPTYRGWRTVDTTKRTREGLPWVCGYGFGTRAAQREQTAMFNEHWERTGGIHPSAE